MSSIRVRRCQVTSSLLEISQDSSSWTPDEWLKWEVWSQTPFFLPSCQVKGRVYHQSSCACYTPLSTNNRLSVLERRLILLEEREGCKQRNRSRTFTLSVNFDRISPSSLRPTVNSFKHFYIVSVNFLLQPRSFRCIVFRAGVPLAYQEDPRKASPAKTPKEPPHDHRGLPDFCDGATLPLYNSANWSLYQQLKSTCSPLSDAVPTLITTRTTHHLLSCRWKP